MKITWKPETQTVIYRSRPHHNTQRNFEIFKAVDFLAAVIDHIPPKSKHTVRYYGVYSNKSRGQISRIPDRIVPASSNQKSKIINHQSEILFVPPPPLRTARSMRPLWRDLILQVWGEVPQRQFVFTIPKTERRCSIGYKCFFSGCCSHGLRGWFEG